MIEIERKFALKEGDKERLINGAEFLKEKIIFDSYYDKDDYSLTSKDTWLRCRNGKFELKMPLHGKEGLNREADQYEEIDSEEGIRTKLNLAKEKSLEVDLEENGYKPFCSYKTIRQEYKKGIFIIDIDEADFGDSSHQLAEIELEAPDEGAIKETIGKILVFANEIGLSNDKIRGKVTEYLRRYDIDHYRALVRAGVCRDY
ncbi:MAG: CYTH domain-containing protein [Candidatus Wolfebacteria bacterium]|nr:CYTH domain-containing protein [Candidatus Wolfebacteria bacterium]